jgi:hypothetical protein
MWAKAVAICALTQMVCFSFAVVFQFWGMFLFFLREHSLYCFISNSASLSEVFGIVVLAFGIRFYASYCISIGAIYLLTSLLGLFVAWKQSSDYLRLVCV